jgi:hypothetical protein
MYIDHLKNIPPAAAMFNDLLLLSSAKIKSNQTILAKLQLAYHEDALCLRVVEKWIARFRAGQETVDDETWPGRPASSDLSEAILRFLEK